LTPPRRSLTPIVGDVVYFKSYGRENIVLNTFEAARALLVLRGRIYSDRPKLVMAREM
jgi:hypothetical protein